MTTNTNIPIVWENSVVNFDSLSIDDFYTKVDAYIEEFNQEFPLSNVEIHISQSTKEEGFDSKNFILKLHLHLQKGKLLLATAENANINFALKTAFKEIQHQSTLSDRQKHSQS